jgi:protein farnesyltransferase/geranylgeranyltransferase type-1 subunit alpha
MDEDYIPWGKREGWADVVPLEQDDGPADLPVIQIPYTAEFKDTMNYFRAMVRKQEYSRRALELCTAAIDLSPPNYTAWRYRRAIMEALNDPELFEADFEYTEELATENAKNYQIWHHRQWLVTQTKDLSRELDFTALLIGLDSKNYHAWSYRQWFIKTHNMWEKELAYLDHLLNQDLRNNSAWNMRFFVFTHAPQYTTLEHEINTAWLWISKSPNNQSPWNYIKGLFASRDYSDFPDVEARCIEALTKYPVCPNPHFLLIDILDRKNTIDSLTAAQSHCDKLISNLDTVHKKYWLFRKSELAKKILSLSK